MDISLGKLSASVRLDLSRLKSDQEKASRSFKDFSKKLTKDVADNATRMGQTLSLGVTTPLLALGKGAVDAAVKMDTMKRSLAAVAGGSKEAERQLVRLREVAKSPALDLEQAVKGSIRLQAAGLSAKEAEKSLLAFSNAVAKVGGGADDIDGVTRALSQMLSKGKVTAEEVFGQLGERLPGLAREMKKVFGTADTEILQKAGVTAEQWVKAMTAHFARMPKVIAGPKEAFAQFQQTLKDGLSEIGNAILPDLLKAMESLSKGIQRFIGWWKSLDDSTRQNIVRFAAFTATIGPMVLAIGGLIRAVSGISAAFVAVRAAAAGMMTTLAGLIPMAGRIASSLAGIFAGSVAMLVGSAGKANAPGRPRGSLQNELAMELKYKDQLNTRLMRDQPAGQRDSDLKAFTNTQARIATLRKQMEEISSKVGPPVPTPADRQYDEMMRQIRASLAGVGGGKTGGGGGGASKAEAAAKRALTEKAQREEIEFRRIKKIEGWNAQWWEQTYKEWEAMARAQAEWDEEAQKAFEKADALDFAKGLRDIKDRANLLEDAGALLRQIAQETAASEAGQRKAGGAALGGAFGAFGNAMGMLSPMAAKAAEVTAAKQIALTDKVTQHQVNMGRISLSAYEQYLSRRLQESRGNLEEEMRIESELQNTRFALWEETERKRYRGWQNLARGMENAFANAFANVLDGGKNLFQSLLDAFKQMLVQMIAQALAAGLVRSLFGGGNFLTGFMSVFGFDNGANDRKAYRWGKDFSHHFTSGAVDYSRTSANRGRSAMAGARAGGAGNVSVNVSIGNVNNYTQADARRIGQEIAMETRNELRRRVR